MIKNSINHLAIIMDGNGRWAKHKNQPRTFGHKYGAQTAKKIINDWFNDLFNWLFKCEKIFGFSTLKGYDQERLYAYLAERYLSFWFRKYTNFLEWHWTFYEKNK